MAVLTIFGLGLFAAPGRASLGTVTDIDAQIASSGKHIWLVKQGRKPSGKVETRVFRYSGRKWRALPGALANPGGGLYLTIRRVGRGSVPCVGYLAPGTGVGFNGPKLRTVVKCFQRGRWRDIAIGDALRDFYMTGLDSRGKHLVALLADVEGRRSKAYVVVASKNRFVRLGRPIVVPRSGASFALGSGTRSAPARLIDVAASDFFSRVDRLWVATMNWGRWLGARRLPNLESGWVATGPVRTRGGLFVPITERLLVPPDDSSWKFSVLGLHNKRWFRVGGGLLNQSEHIEEGGLGIYPVGNRVWASWTEKVGEPAIRPATRDFVAPLSGRKLTAKVVWSGKPWGRGLHGVALFRGRIAVLYMRGEPDSYMSHATVRLLGAE